MTIFKPVTTKAFVEAMIAEADKNESNQKAAKLKEQADYQTAIKEAEGFQNLLNQGKMRSTRYQSFIESTTNILLSECIF